MILFPAIDILEGRAVRLYKGDRNAVTDYGDPLEFAEKWAEAGAQWLHIVDLSGAFSGKSGIDKTISEIKKRFKINIQSGGGLRTVEDVERRLDAGADRAVIGTMAAYDPDAFALAAFRFSGKIVAGIDARGGMFAVKGWTEQTDMTAVYFGKKCKKWAYGMPFSRTFPRTAPWKASTCAKPSVCRKRRNFPSSPRAAFPPCRTSSTCATATFTARCWARLCTRGRST